MANQLTRKRGAVKSKLTIFNKFVANLNHLLDSGEEVPDDKIFELDQRCTRAQNLLEEFDEIQIAIETSVDDYALIEEYKERESFTAAYYQIIAVAKRILKKKKSFKCI